MDHLSLAYVLRSSIISVFLDISGISEMLGITCFVGFLLGSCRSSLLLKGIIMVTSVFQVPGVYGLGLKLFISNSLLLYSKSSFILVILTSSSSFNFLHSS